MKNPLEFQNLKGFLFFENILRKRLKYTIFAKYIKQYNTKLMTQWV